MLLKTYCDSSQDLFFKSIGRYVVILMCPAALFGGLGAQKMAMSRRTMQDLSVTGDFDSFRY
jgi:hypothetical protein